MTMLADLNKITDADIKAAIAIDDIDDALIGLQNIAKVDDGGVAGMVFSDHTFDWATASRAEREEMVRHWIEVEGYYADDSE